ncbi:hypothetical protein [Aureimonas psammosilenae]|uniref:hypothetical protein n=1 Tax=Aureimonas psammosilenae TaxID=2495496 RepID=UPI0012610488|nr:hypothetical protein [Aureimonas psammosilenae]
MSLFIRDKDPWSVQALACGGSEVIEGLAEQAKLPTLSTHILNTFGHIDLRGIRKIRNQYWNAIKHFSGTDRKTARDDEELLSDFSDRTNDGVLFNGWLDYLLLTKRLPVEVQVFQVWWYATNEDRLSPSADRTPHRTLFPNIERDDRREQKRRLRRVAEKYARNPAILADPRTEPGPLVMRSW